VNLRAHKECPATSETFFFNTRKWKTTYGALTWMFDRRAKEEAFGLVYSRKRSGDDELRRATFLTKADSCGPKVGSISFGPKAILKK
jgi:hypothetical protein